MGSYLPFNYRSLFLANAFARPESFRSASKAALSGLAAPAIIATIVGSTMGRYEQQFESSDIGAGV
jgi:hypothetical protein